MSDPLLKATYLAVRLLDAALRRTGRAAGVAVVFHRVGRPSDRQDRELVPARAPTQLIAELEMLTGLFTPVVASELPEAIANRRRGEPFPLSVTFDDDLPEHVRHALPILEQLDFPATFFVCGASLHRPRSFWWERLQRAFDSSQYVGDIHAEAAAIQALSPAERDSIDETLLQRAGPDPPHSGLRSEQLLALADRGFEIGFHTQRHDDLTGLDSEQLASAMTAGREQIEEVTGKPLRAIAYPHGSFEPRVGDAARAAGYTVGFTLEPDAVTGEDRLRSGRILTDRLSSRGLLLAIERAILAAR